MRLIGRLVCRFGRHHWHFLGTQEIRTHFGEDGHHSQYCHYFQCCRCLGKTALWSPWIGRTNHHRSHAA